MDPNPSPNPEPALDLPQSTGLPGQVVGPDGSVQPSQSPAPSPPTVIPSAPPTVSPLPTVPVPQEFATPAPDLPRPTAVADSPAPDSSIVLPPAPSTYGSMSYNESAASAKTPFMKKFAGKRMLLMIGLPLLLFGSSAAAYFGYVVPNKPQNVLAKALSNTLSKHQFTTTGTVDLTASGVSSKVEYTIKADADNHATDSQVDVSVSGVKVPVELMTAKGNAYFKIGSISGLSGALSAILGDSSQAQAIEDQINSKVANQWVEIDSTLLKEIKLSCLTNYPAVFSQSDITVLQSTYKKNSFATITSTTSENVNGSSAYKYELQIDDNKLADFKPGNSTYFNNVKKCLGDIGQSTGSSTSSLKDNDKTPLTLWVDKNTKTIVKYATKSTAQDKAKDDTEGTLTGTITYDKVSISPPSNTKSVLDVLGSLDLNSLGFGDLFSDPSTSSATNSADAERKTDINAMHGQIEAYWATNGYYPTLANLNEANWRSTNMPDLDDAAVKDPAGSSGQIISAPAAHAYSYEVLPAGCDNVKVQCQSYTLTTTLEDGSAYVKQSLDDSSSSILN